MSLASFSSTMMSAIRLPTLQSVVVETQRRYIAFDILREWLAGKGVKVSWDSLIATLRNSELSLMADQIQMALDQFYKFFFFCFLFFVSNFSSFHS